MSAEQKSDQFDQHTKQVREYARKHGISNAAAARRIYKAKMQPQWAAEKTTEPKEGEKSA